MENYTITESYTLPSKGKVYKQQIKADITLRSMTTADEMRRLSQSDKPYKLLSEIIDGCILDNPGISCYDMCMGDYQFLLYKLRTVTYGSDYKVDVVCPHCLSRSIETIDLDQLKVLEYDSEFDNYLHIELPISKKQIDLRLQTPRMLDEVTEKAKDISKRFPEYKGEPAFLCTLDSIVYKIDGQMYDDIEKEAFLKNLPMKDVNYILKTIKKVDIGIENETEIKCSKCGKVHRIIIPITGEFFGPSID